MQLDRTLIAIRPRGIWDLLDLSLRVTRIYARPLLIQTIIAVLPFAIFNFAILHWLLADESTEYTRRSYYVCMMLLVFLEAPIATLPATQLLGRAMFRQSIQPRLVWSELREVAWRIVWVQGFWRAGLLTILIGLHIGTQKDVDSATALLIMLSIYSFLLRAGRPFINEIILLERAPVRSTKPASMSITRRSRAIHGPSSGDLFLRWAMAAIATGILTFNLTLVCWFASSMLSGDWFWSRWMVEFASPACMWLVSIYATVFKFLNYLDIRIRHEGWEVELSIKAAAQELRGAT